MSELGAQHAPDDPNASGAAKPSSEPGASPVDAAAPVDAVGKPAEQVDGDDLARSAGRGALWQVGGAWLQTAIQMGSSAVLARVLFPRDFGTLGMALLAQGLIVRLGSLGSTAGVIAKKDVDQTDLSTAFWTSAMVQGGMFLLALLGAPLLAWAFTPLGSVVEDPDVVFDRAGLIWVMRAVAVMFLFNAVGSISAALLRKGLRFGTLKIIELGAFVVQTGITIYLALVLRNYWALVIGMLIGGLLQAAATVIVARWLPSFAFSGSSFRYMFRFGANEFGTNMLNYFLHNIDYMLVGKMFGTAVLGLYEFAYRIPHLALNRLSGPINAVMFPTMAQVNDDDHRLARGYVKVVHYISLIAFPVLGGLAAVARPTVATLWGEKWLPIVPALQILCVSAALRCIVSPVGTIFLCKNRPDIPFKLSIAVFAWTAVAVAALGMSFGHLWGTQAALNGVALGMVLSVLPTYFTLWLAFRMVRQPMSMLGRALWPPVAVTAITVAVALVVHYLMARADLAPWWQLLAVVPAGVATYIGAMRLLFPEVVKNLFDLVKTVLLPKR